MLPYGANNIGAYSAGSYDCTMALIQAAKAVLASGAKPPANSGDSARGNGIPSGHGQCHPAYQL